jgi:hypothetical protein
MSALRTVAIVLLFAAVASADDNKLPTSASSGWGPSWVGGAPPGGNPRPKKFEKPLTVPHIRDDRSEIGICVDLWSDAQVQKGNKYQLMYQVRVHVKKGELGPVLGTTDKPDGISIPITSATADDSWNGLEARVDVNRKDLSGMTNLPAEGLVALRIEPHLYDETAGKFVTPGKTPAIIVMATVGKRGRVESVVSLRAWIAANAEYHADKVLETLAGLDEYHMYENGIGEAIATALTSTKIPTETKVKFIKAVPKELVDPRLSGNLWTALNKFADGEDADLKAAAKAKLEK